MRACQCPNCNAQISFDESREFGFCQYCGTKIILDDYRSSHHIVDEARIQETETDRIIRLRELELEEKENDRSRKGRMIAFMIALAFVLVGALVEVFDHYNTLGIFIMLGGVYIAMFTFMSADSQKKKLTEARNARNGMIKLTSAATEYTGKNYRSLEATYARLGFQNIVSVNMRDLRFGLLNKPGTIDSITIDGEEPNEGTWYSPHAKVLISYHGSME